MPTRTIKYKSIHINTMTENFDVQYEQLMEKYKELRMDPDKVKESLKVLDRAMELRRKGKVSETSIEAARYF